MAMEDSSTSSHDKRASQITASSAMTSSSRCSQCSRPSRLDSDSGRKPTRNIVVCIDGTSNQFGQKNTNVVKLFSQIDLETTKPEQYAYYSSGIGTRPKSSQILNRAERAISDKFDMAIAWNMEEIVKDAYSWLARTYQEGDKIYLFGFSRGAYQVRVLAWMIHEVGLIRTPTEKQIGTAYDHYEETRSRRPKARQIAREFKHTFSWKDVGVHFVGVWDTVSSVGLIRGDVLLSTSSSKTHACYFRHALALDERRVKFIPEYFCEMNSPTYDGRFKYSSAASKRPDRTEIDNGPKVKEVWFAGTHSDVGGTNRPGKSHQAGNASLIWMRREAAGQGLVLRPTDIVWVPDDLDHGINDSMDFGWKVLEYMPLKHQTSFSGTGENTRRQHLKQPRRIIPGQKVHASILYAKAYKPQATLGEGFDIPFVHGEPENTILDEAIWEDGLFDYMAAQELLDYLKDAQGIAPIYLDRLLFMLRFEEGRQYVKKVPDWEERIKGLIENKPSLVSLVALVAYYEATPDTAHKFEDDIFKAANKCLTDILNNIEDSDGPRVVALLRPLAKHQILRARILNKDVLDNLVARLDAILEKETHHFGQAMDGLNCLLQCEQTRKTLVEKLMETPSLGRTLFQRLKERSLGLNHNTSRLSLILQVDEPHLLAAALRMVLTFVRTPEAREVAKVVESAKAAKGAKVQKVEETMVELAGPAGPVEATAGLALRATPAQNAEFWSAIKRRIRQLATGKDRLVGHLAVEVLFALYSANNASGPKQPDTQSCSGRMLLKRFGLKQLDNPCFQANVASVLTSLKLKKEGSGDGQGHEQTLKKLFGLGAKKLEDIHKELIKRLKEAVENGDAQKRTAGTLTLLDLCESEIIRSYLLEIGLLDLFINQLQRKGCALLAARALVVCLEHSDMKNSMSVKNYGLLPRRIVGMLQMDYFDDAVGKVEGFEIFRDFMKHDDLREKIKSYNITEVLCTKLKRGKAKETRTSLICLEIFLSFDSHGPWPRKLVDSGLEYLANRVPKKENRLWKTLKTGVTESSAWKTLTAGETESRIWGNQKAGMMILCALAQTESGTTAIMDSISDIVGMLLPKEHRPIKAKTSTDQAESPASASDQLQIEEETRRADLSSSDESQIQSDTTTQPVNYQSSKSSSWMMGPACVLRTFAQNEELRKRIRKTQEYIELKNLHLNGTLVNKRDTSAWRIGTPNRNDVINMLDKMIKAVDKEICEEGLTSIGHAALPHIKHWNRLMKILGNGTVTAITILPAALGVSTVAILAAVLGTPIYLSSEAYAVFKRRQLQRENNRILKEPHGEETGSGSHGASAGQEGGDPSGGYKDSPQAVEVM